MNYAENTEYQELVASWALYKKQEQEANAARLAVENRLLDIVGNDLKVEGTNNLPGGLKVVTGMNTTVDNTKAAVIYQNFLAGQTTLDIFPLRQKWEPDTRAIKELVANKPEVYNQYFAEILTIKPKKPGFEVKGA